MTTQLTVESVIKPKRPKGKGWIEKQTLNQEFNFGFPHAAFAHQETGLFCISAVEVADTEPGKQPLGPEYHLSISKHGKRCTSQEAKWALRQFGLEDAEEDNHVPNGFVRNFWRPVADRLSGYQCPCKAHEPAMREDKGDFVWRGVTR